MFKNKNLPPGNLGLPFIGEAIEQFSTHHLFYWKRFKRYGDVYKTQFIGIKTICLIGPEANQFVLQTKAKSFSQQGWKFLMPLIGEDGLTLLDGEKHRLIKNLMYPAFHGESLNYHLSIIVEIVKSFFSQIPQQKEVFLLENSRKLSLLISCYLLIGRESKEIEIKELMKYFSDLVEGVETVLRIDTSLTKYGRGRIARKKIEQLFQKIVEARKETKQVSDSRSILDFLCSGKNEIGTKLSKKQIVRQMLQLLYSGYETTSKLISWCLFELNRHPDWIKRLKKEQQDVLRDKEDLDNFALKDFCELTLFVKETARLYSPAYMFPREVTENLDYKGFLIPKGWLVLLSPLITHRLPDLYHVPDNFDPLRFASSRKEDKRHPYGFIPFGAGAHRCIGEDLALMEVKVILSELICNHKWEVTPKAPDVVPIGDIYSLENNMKIKFI